MLRSVENVGSTIFLKTLNRNDMEKIIMTLIKKYQTFKEVVYEDDEHDEKDDKKDKNMKIIMVSLS